MSRPPEADRAADRLKARDTLNRVAPALATLRMAIRDSDNPLDRGGAERLLCELIEDIELAERDSAVMTALTNAAAADPAAAAMLAYMNASKVSANVMAVRTAIEQLAETTRATQTAALLDLIVAASQSPKVPTYVQKLVDELLAVGLTNELNSAQRRAIKAILGDPDYGNGKKVAIAPVAATGPLPVIAASWVALPDPVPGFSFVRDKTHQNVFNRAVIDAGLPPGTSLDFFACGALLDLADIEGNRAKANFAWQTMKAWLADTGRSDARLDMHRKNAWTFLLGHVHGFLAGVHTIDNVTFASPWASDEVIHARRKVEKPDEG